MSNRKNFNQKMEEEIARAQTELARFRAMGMGFTAEAKDRHDECVAELEQKLDATKASLRNVIDAHEDAWESLTHSMENTWSTLQSAFQEVVENFKAEPPPRRFISVGRGIFSQHKRIERAFS